MGGTLCAESSGACFCGDSTCSVDAPDGFNPNPCPSDGSCVVNNLGSICLNGPSFGCSSGGSNSFGVPAFCCTGSPTGSGAGDPHISGPHGEKFDFFGKTGGNYVMFSSPRFIVNAMLDTIDHTEARFMTQIALLVGNATVTLNTNYHLDGFIEQLNKQLIPNGAKAFYPDGNRFAVHIELCDGQSVVITQHYTDGGSEIHLASRAYYLDVQLDIAGCHDEFGGIIGQMYQCQYARGQAFVWQGGESVEETFRVPTLEKPSGAFGVDGACLGEHEFGVQFADGTTTSAMK